MHAKNMKAYWPEVLERPTTTGNDHEMIVHMNQCVKLPSAWPFARTAFGKISAMKTQITAPCEMAKNAMKPRIAGIAMYGIALSPRPICQAARQCIAQVPKAPNIKSARRPNQSMKKNAAIVNVRLMVPSPTVLARAALVPKPNISKIRGA